MRRDQLVTWTSEYFTFYVFTHFTLKIVRKILAFLPVASVKFYVFYQHPRHWTAIISSRSSLAGKLEPTVFIPSCSTHSHCLFKVRMLKDSTSQRSRHGYFHDESSVILNKFCRCRSLVAGDVRHLGSPVTGNRALSRFSPVSSLQRYISGMSMGLNWENAGNCLSLVIVHRR